MVLAQVAVRNDGHDSLPMSHKRTEMKGKSQNERAEELRAQNLGSGHDSVTSQLSDLENSLRLIFLT